MRPVVAFVFLMAAAGVSGQSKDLAFQFLTCGAFDLEISSVLGTGDTAFYEHQMRSKVEEEIRAAEEHSDLFTTGLDGMSTLRVVFSKVDDWHHIWVVFHKAVYEPTSNVLTTQSTWTDEAEGSGDDDTFMADFSKILDKFLARYTVVNTKEACAKEVVQAGKRILQVMEIAGGTDASRSRRTE